MTVFAVTFENLVTVAVAAAPAGIGVTAVFSLALLAVIRGAEARRAGRSAGAWPVLATVATAGVVLASVAGIYVVAGS